MTDTQIPGGAPLTSREQILTDLKRIAVEALERSPEQLASVGMDTPLVEGMQLDSLAQVVLVSRIEEEFGLQFDVSDWEEISTVEQLIAVIEKRGAKVQAAAN